MYRSAATAVLCLVPVLSMAADTRELSGPEGCRIVNTNKIDRVKPTWSGDCRDGLAEGRGILEWHDKNRKLISRFEGDIKAGLRHGQGSLWLDEGNRYEGGFLEGRYHGTGTLVTIQGRYEGEFLHGKRSGYGKMVYVTGGRYEGQWLAGCFDGAGTAVYASGREVSTEWIKCKRADLAAPPPAPGAFFRVRPSTPAYGSNIYTDPTLDTTIPLRRTYSKMSAEEKRKLHSWFPLIDEGDEPPYPLYGLMPISTRIAEGRSVVGGEWAGPLNIYVDVDAQGNPTGVSVFATPNKEIADYAVAEALKHKFKPAVCAGKPCAMKFPLLLHFGYSY